MFETDNEFSEQVFKDIVHYIHNKLPSPITTSDLQTLSGYSKRHLSRLFLKYAGVTPYIYIRSLSTYRLFLELKLTTITLEELCEKYNIKSKVSLAKRIEKGTGESIEKTRVSNHIDIGGILNKNRIKNPKMYISCSFVSLFDYEIQAKGVRYSFGRVGGMLMSSHYPQIEKIVSCFCSEYNIERDDVWVCVRFLPLDKNEYEVELYTVLTGDTHQLTSAKSVSLQGDYICFSWEGRDEDTFSRIKSFYDVFFLEFLATRKNGHDILYRQKITAYKDRYVFKYYIPVVINEAILSVN